jgi:hypothetical protein
MPGVLFTNALMLAGLTALAIPVIIHLLLKRKKKRLRFSTNQFFVKHDKQSSQRRKLRNWLLLALRLLIVTLLVLAFARPYLPRTGAAAIGQKRQAIIVLDRSASMRAISSDGQRWSKAKEQASKILAGLQRDDRAALISCSSHTDVLSGLAPAGVVEKLLGGLLPAYGTSDLAQGLQQAVKLVSATDPHIVSTVYVISDLQRSACHKLGSTPLPQSLDIKLIPVGDLASPNLALTDVEVESHEGARPHAVLANYSDEEIPGATLELNVDGQNAFSRPLRLGAGATTNVELFLPPLKAGWHNAQVTLRTKDALEIDNMRYATLLIPEPTRVLLVETRPSQRVFQQETFFLSLALDPTKDSTNPVPATFNLLQTTPEDAFSKLSGSQGRAAYDLVVLPGLKEIPSGGARALEAFVEAGGGLLLFLGDHVNANRYNNELGKLLPALVGDAVSAEAGLPWHMSEFNTNVAVFAAFRLPNSGDLHLAEFTKRFTLTRTSDGLQSAAFDDEVPLLVTRAVGHGRVALVNSSADTSWNDWPKHKTFVPWIHGLGKYLTQKIGHDPLLQTNNLVAEADVDLELGSGARQGQFKLQSAPGKEVLLKADDQGRLRDLGLTVPGIYSLRDVAGKEIRRLAVNLPAQESDLNAFRPAEVQAQFVRVAEAPKTALAAGLFGPTSNQKEFCSVLLLSVLALLFIELAVANRTLA